MKSKIHVLGQVKLQSFRMYSNLNCYQLKLDCYKYKLLCVSLMITTKQKPIADTQKVVRKASKHATKENLDSPSLLLLFGLIDIYPVPLPGGYSSVSSSCLYC